MEETRLLEQEVICVLEALATLKARNAGVHTCISITDKAKINEQNSGRTLLHRYLL